MMGRPDFRRDGFHRFKVALRRNGKSGFQDVHAQAIELARHLELLRKSMLHPGDCSPSRSVVSKMYTRSDIAPPELNH